MKAFLASLCLCFLLAAPAWAGQYAIPAGGQCSLAMDSHPSPVEVVNLDQEQNASVLGYWLYSTQNEPRRVMSTIKPGEALIFSPPKSTDGQGNSFTVRTLVLYNTGATPLSARTVK